MAKKDGELTPMMKQFFDLKAKHPDAVMLFRCGGKLPRNSTLAFSGRKGMSGCHSTSFVLRSMFSLFRYILFSGKVRKLSVNR